MRTMSRGWSVRWGVAVGAALALHVAMAQPHVAAGSDLPAKRGAAGERTLADWLNRLQEASRGRAYTGTFVVSSASGDLSSARISHVCDGVQQMERVDSLTGTPRTTLRRDDQVVTFLPEAKVVRVERRSAVGLFPNLFQPSDHALDDFYGVRSQGSERVAGLEADIVQLTPKDNFRFGYRIWSEKRTGLLVKLQTLDVDGRVLEQSAFSELRLDAPLKMEPLAQMMANTEGYRVEKADSVKTTPAAEGWALRNPVPGFKSVSCHRRPAPRGAATPVVQWVFSDGLASVSLFVQAFERQHHPREGVVALGATMTLTRRLPSSEGDWWLTVVGEVPSRTLKAFADSLERRK